VQVDPRPSQRSQKGQRRGVFGGSGEFGGSGDSGGSGGSASKPVGLRDRGGSRLPLPAQETRVWCGCCVGRASRRVSLVVSLVVSRGSSSGPSGSVECARLTRKGVIGKCRITSHLRCILDDRDFDCGFAAGSDWRITSPSCAVGSSRRRGVGCTSPKSKSVECRIYVKEQSRVLSEGSRGRKSRLARRSPPQPSGSSERRQRAVRRRTPQTAGRRRQVA
jgi:hypothetical protein